MASLVTKVYLAEIPEPMANAVLSLIGHQLGGSLDEGQEREIRNRTDIGPTEKYQLVMSAVLGKVSTRKNLELTRSRM